MADIHKLPGPPLDRLYAALDDLTETNRSHRDELMRAVEKVQAQLADWRAEHSLTIASQVGQVERRLLEVVTELERLSARVSRLEHPVRRKKPRR